MLGFLRRDANKFLIKAIIGLISIVFIFFFGSSALLSDQTQKVAEVDGYAIRDVDLNRRWRLEIRNAQRFNPNLTETDKRRIRQQALDYLIDRRLVTEEARRQGFVVSAREIQQALRESPSFQDEEGNFDMDRYKQYLGSNPGRAASRLQADYEEGLLYQSVINFVRDTVMLDEGEVRQTWERENSKRNVEFVKITTSSFRSDVKLEGDELKAFVEENSTAIRERYDRDFDRKYNVPKKVGARHILLKFNEDDDEDTRQTIRDRMAAILGEARADGAEFATLAQKYSEDGSATRGGDLGIFDENRMVKPFSEAAFSMAAGDISDVVETKYGLHIIKVHEVIEPSVRALEEVETEVALEIAREEIAPELAKAYADQVVGALNGSLDEAKATELLDSRGMDVQESGDFNGAATAIPKVGTSKAAVEAAFALPEVGSVVGEPIEVPVGYVVLRLKSRTEPTEEGYEGKKEELRDRLLLTKQAQVVRDWKNDLKASANILVVPGV
ncbi:MAG: hypothetical protein CL928_13805 [Deltaproteobacteria bacterium]|nr:hypothetical protein [Deltaproteobacteria bacterium]